MLPQHDATVSPVQNFLRLTVNENQTGVRILKTKIGLTRFCRGTYQKEGGGGYMPMWISPALHSVRNNGLLMLWFGKCELSNILIPHRITSRRNFCDRQTAVTSRGIRGSAQRGGSNARNNNMLDTTFDYSGWSRLRQHPPAFSSISMIASEPPFLVRSTFRSWSHLWYQSGQRESAELQDII